MPPDSVRCRACGAMTPDENLRCIFCGELIQARGGMLGRLRYGGVARWVVAAIAAYLVWRLVS